MAETPAAAESVLHEVLRGGRCDWALSRGWLLEGRSTGGEVQGMIGRVAFGAYESEVFGCEMMDYFEGLASGE